MGDRIVEDELRMVPANEASADDVQALFTEGDAAVRCQCQWFRSTPAEHRRTSRAERSERLAQQAHFGDPDAPTTTGIVAYLGDDAVGWCAVAPRSVYLRLRNSRMVWAGRQEDPGDDSVWVVSCFVCRRGYRKRGVSHALTRAAVDFARNRGAAAVEGYPLITGPGRDVGWGELFVGSTGAFAAAGFVELGRPTARRAVMRIEL